MKKPVVLVVMDGVGETPEELGNMVKKATTPTLNELKETCPWQIIKAHGTAVGLPSDDDMGNSEVGHNALGCGQIYSQGAKLVNESIESGKIYTSDAWKNLVSDLKDNGATLHFIGLLSDGNVHSNIKHLFNMIKKAKSEGISKVRVHALLDGRDVPAGVSALHSPPPYFSNRFFFSFCPLSFLFIWDTSVHHLRRSRCSRVISSSWLQ